jgi:hypothetical protein
MTRSVDEIRSDLRRERGDLVHATGALRIQLDVRARLGGVSAKRVLAAVLLGLALLELLRTLIRVAVRLALARLAVRVASR